MERVFRALADRVRRRILDLLRARDGRTLQDLCRHFRMSRFGVMKHLRVLERAHLVVVLRAGRWAHHYLNPVPLQQIADRWMSRYAQAIAPALTRLKRELEKEKAIWPRRASGTSTRSTSRQRSPSSGKRSRASTSSGATTTTTA